jgi:hypothetical protein
MQQAWQDAFDKSKVVKTSAGAIAHADDRSIEKFEYHRQKLVELGSIAERHYTFQHLLVPTDESKHFARSLLSHQCPSYIDFSSEYPPVPVPMQLTIWCDLPDVGSWNKFFAEHDVSDYHKRFMMP